MNLEHGGCQPTHRAEVAVDQNDKMGRIIVCM